MFELLFGIVAFTIIVILALFTDKDSERYDQPETLLGVVYPDPDTKDKKDA
jgi:hypothetical protein